MKISTVEGSRSRLFDGILTGTVDIAIVTGEPSSDCNRSMVLWSERIIVALPGRLLEQELDRPTVITEGGRTYRIRKGEAFYRSLVARSIDGDMRAAALVARLADRLRLSEPDDRDDEKIIVRVVKFADPE